MDERLRILRRRAQTGSEAAVAEYISALERTIFGRPLRPNEPVYVWLSVSIAVDNSADAEIFDERSIQVFTSEEAAFRATSLWAIHFFRELRKDDYITAEELRAAAQLHKNKQYQQVIDLMNARQAGTHVLLVVRKAVRNLPVRDP